MQVLAIPPNSPRKKNGFKNIPVRSEPTVVRIIETGSAYLRPKLPITQSITALDNPNLNHGNGFGIIVSAT